MDASPPPLAWLTCVCGPSFEEPVSWICKELGFCLLRRSTWCMGWMEEGSTVVDSWGLGVIYLIWEVLF